MSAAVVMAALLWLTSLLTKRWTQWYHRRHQHPDEVTPRALGSDHLVLQDGIVRSNRFDEAGARKVSNR
jgi:hypothetical protein